MGNSLPPTIDRPAGCPTDVQFGHAFYPIPEPCHAFPWGRPVSLFVAPLVMTASHLLYELEGRFWIARRGVGGIYLHAGLTRDGWIQANGAKFTAIPALIIAAAALVDAVTLPDGNREWAKAALIDSLESGDAIRQGVGRG